MVRRFTLADVRVLVRAQQQQHHGGVGGRHQALDVHSETRDEHAEEVDGAHDELLLNLHTVRLHLQPANHSPINHSSS
jgi:hypothetical protein